jgi:hypothetical protein
MLYIILGLLVILSMVTIFLLIFRRSDKAKCPAVNCSQIQSSNLTNFSETTSDKNQVIFSLSKSDLDKVTNNAWTRVHSLTINGKIYDKKNGNPKIKVRGFSSSFQDKKPYNIKFDSNISIANLGTSKKWALMGEFYDMTLILNQLTYALGGSIGLPSPPWQNVTFLTTESSGQTYHGLYSLTKKFTAVDIVSGGADAIIEFDRPDADKNLFPVVEAFCNSTPIVYDFNSSKYPTITDVKTNLAPLYQSILTTPDLSTILDYNSFADYFIISELANSVDGYLDSTYTYVLTKNKNQKIYMGFIWDYNMAFGNYIDTVVPKSVESGFWSCRSPQVVNRWRYYDSNRFAMSSSDKDPTNVANYNKNPVDNYMINLRGLPGPDGKPTKDPNNFISFSRNCTGGNLVTNWYVKLMNDDKFKQLVQTKYRQYRTSNTGKLSDCVIFNLINKFSSPLKDLTMAPKDIQTWFNVNNTPNITTVRNPKQDLDSALDFYTQTLDYMKKWVKERLAYLDSVILVQNLPDFPKDTANLNRWNDYQTSCNMLPDFYPSKF